MRRTTVDIEYEKASESINDTYSVHLARIDILRDAATGSLDAGVFDSLVSSGRVVEEWIDENRTVLTTINRTAGGKRRLVWFSTGTIRRIRKLATKVADERATIAECREFLSTIKSLTSVVTKTNDDWHENQSKAIDDEYRKQKANR
jgi:hypothetical protein